LIIDPHKLNQGIIHHWCPVVTTAATETAIAACPSLQAIRVGTAIAAEDNSAGTHGADKEGLLPAVLYGAVIRGDVNPRGS